MKIIIEKPINQLFCNFVYKRDDYPIQISEEANCIASAEKSHNKKERGNWQAKVIEVREVQYSSSSPDLIFKGNLESSQDQGSRE